MFPSDDHRDPPSEDSAARPKGGGVSDVAQGDFAPGAGLLGGRSGAVSRWRPILSGTTAERALQAVDAIAECITSSSALPGVRDPSLGRGQAGLALLYAWLART